MWLILEMITLHAENFYFHFLTKLFNVGGFWVVIFDQNSVDSISWYDIELFSYELIIFRNDYSLTFACLEPDPAIYLNNFGTSVVLL